MHDARLGSWRRAGLAQMVLSEHTGGLEPGGCHTLSARQDFLSFRSWMELCRVSSSSPRRRASVLRSLPLNTRGTTTGATSRPCTKPTSCESRWAVLPSAVWVPGRGRACFSSLQLAHCFLIALEDGLAASQRVGHCSCVRVFYLMCFLGWVMNKYGGSRNSGPGSLRGAEKKARETGSPDEVTS